VEGTTARPVHSFSCISRSIASGNNLKSLFNTTEPPAIRRV